MLYSKCQIKTMFPNVMLSLLALNDVSSNTIFRDSPKDGLYLQWFLRGYDDILQKGYHEGWQDEWAQIRPLLFWFNMFPDIYKKAE